MGTLALLIVCSCRYSTYGRASGDDMAEVAVAGTLLSVP